MPDQRRASRFAFAAAFDATPWAGVDVFTRGDGDPVTMPDYAAGEGLYLDGLHALHGFGQAVGMTDDLAAGDITVELDAADRLVITNNDPDHALTLGASADNAWFGLPTALTVIAADGGQLVGSDWRRGVLSNGLTAAPPRLTFVKDATFYRTPAFAIVQDVRVAVRTRGDLDDLDDVDTTIESLDIATNGAGYRWAVDDDGHVITSGTDASAFHGITWLSTTFRDRLGFDGTETVQTTAAGGLGGGFSNGDMYSVRANRPMPGLIVPTRPLAAQTAVLEEFGSQTRLISGLYATSHVATYRGYNLEWVLDGPDGAVDLHEHWQDLRENHLRAGEPVTLYQNWGDSRRALHPQRVTVDQVAHDLLYTAERAGYRGRILCRLHADGADEETIKWDGKLRQRARMRTRVVFREAGV